MYAMVWEANFISGMPQRATAQQSIIVQPVRAQLTGTIGKTVKALVAQKRYSTYSTTLFKMSQQPEMKPLYILFRFHLCKLI